MLEKLVFKKDFRCFKEQYSLVFKPELNLIVGENGCGKSTLLSLIGNKYVSGIRSEDIVELITNASNLATESYYLDLEKNKARYPQGDLQYGFQVAHLISSHGQSVNALLKSISRIPNNSLVLIDEPDLALSIKSIVNLYYLLKEQSKTKQIICSVHNTLLMYLVKEVLVIDKQYWLSANDYIQSELGKVKHV